MNTRFLENKYEDSNPSNMAIILVLEWAMGEKSKIYIPTGLYERTNIFLCQPGHLPSDLFILFLFLLTQLT